MSRNTRSSGVCIVSPRKTALRRHLSSAAMYAPLVLHTVITLTIGYGVVIPQSCIAGLNELTVGFAAAVLGFAPTYVAGVALARRYGARAHA